MNEEFKEVIIRQYFDVINNFILQSPYHELDQRITNLIKSALRDGLDEATIRGLIYAKLPHDYSTKIAA